MIIPTRRPASSTHPIYHTPGAPFRNRLYSACNCTQKRIMEPVGRSGPLPSGAAAVTGFSGRTEAVASARGTKVAAQKLPVARVAVDMPLPHLDRPFDYLVPDGLAPDAVPGCTRL